MRSFKNVGYHILNIFHWLCTIVGALVIASLLIWLLRSYYYNSKPESALYGNWSLAAYNTNAVDKTQSIFLKLNNNTGDTSIWGEYLASISLKNYSLLPNDMTELLQGFYEDGKSGRNK